MPRLVDLLEKLKVLPVLIVDSEEEALHVARALSTGGLKAVEITLRSSAALAAIRAVKQSFPGMTVAAGTVLTAADMRAVSEAGADFAVSPGFTVSLTQAARAEGLPFLPGVSTASEILSGCESGHECFKLFPAAAVGGIDLLKSLASPFPHIRFCPTGGISEDSFREYLALPNVVCIGGSWMVNPELIKASRWDRIAELAQACASGASLS